MTKKPKYTASSTNHQCKSRRSKLHIPNGIIDKWGGWPCVLKYDWGRHQKQIPCRISGTKKFMLFLLFRSCIYFVSCIYWKWLFFSFLHILEFFLISCSGYLGVSQNDPSKNRIRSGITAPPTLPAQGAGVEVEPCPAFPLFFVVRDLEQTELMRKEKSFANFYIPLLSTFFYVEQSRGLKPKCCRTVGLLRDIDRRLLIIVIWRNETWVKKGK